MAWIRACGGGSPAVPDGRTVTPINDVTIWQQCAGIANPTYTTLAEILADVGVLSVLMASNNAVDYLVRCTGFIGCLVPAMTSYNTPIGVVSASSEANATYPAWQAFDGKHSSTADLGWLPYSTAEYRFATGEYVKYQFSNPTKVKMAKVGYVITGTANVIKFKIQGSNDNSQWTDLCTEQTLSATVTQSINWTTVQLTNNTEYEYVRWITTANSSTGGGVGLKLIFYSQDSDPTLNSNAMQYIGANNYCANTLLADSDWRDAIINSAYFESVLNAKVPVMTGNDTPSGHCFEQSNWPSGNAWYAFDGNSTSGNGYIVSTSGTRPTNVRVGYQFTSAPTIYKCIMYPDTNQTIMKPKNAKFQYSTDGITFTDATSYTDVTSLSILTKRLSGITAQYWAVFIDTNQSSNYGLAFRELQFYGRVDV